MIKKKDQLFTSEKAVIASDLFLPLKLYKIPKIFFSQLYKSFPNIKFVELNTPGSPIYNNDASIYFGNIITKETIKKMPGLKWIHFGSVGINRANIKEVYERKIIVTNSKGLLTNSMVTTTLAFISSLFRGIHYCNNLKNENNLSRESFDKYFNNITDLYNKSCLIVGYGDVGKKLAKFKTTKPPLKGKKRKRKGTKESDWRDYWGSSDNLKEDIALYGEDNFIREILHVCPSRGVASYLEAQEQFDRKVLLTDDYYNGIINVRVGGSKILKEALSNK